MKYTIDELRRMWLKIQTYCLPEYAAYWFSKVYYPQATAQGEYIG